MSLTYTGSIKQGCQGLLSHQALIRVLPFPSGDMQGLAKPSLGILPQPSEDEKSFTACRRRRRRCHCCWRWAGASAVLYSLSKAFAPPAAAAIVFPASARQEQTGPAPAPLVSGAFPAVQTTGRQRTTLASGQKTCNQQGLRWLSIIFCLHLSSHLGFLLGENSSYLLP